MPAVHERGERNGHRTCNYSSISVQFLPALISYQRSVETRRNSCHTNTESDAYLIDRDLKILRDGRNNFRQIGREERRRETMLIRGDQWKILHGARSSLRCTRRCTCPIYVGEGTYGREGCTQRRMSPAVRQPGSQPQSGGQSAGQVEVGR